VCTVGHVDGIAALADQGWRRLNLSFSLHAADDDLRAAIMPTAKRWPLKAIQEALIAYRPRPNFQLGINYTLLPGINDRAGDAAAVAEFCRPLGRVQVNCIPYNPDDQPLTRAPEEREIVTFVEALRAEGLSVRRRITKGRDIAAACGQLAGGSAGAIS
jgi:23S rRNA (adenine2503-C2)-methyltransferase